MAIGNLVAVPDLQSDGPAHLVAQKQGFLHLRFLRSGADMTQEAKRVVRYLLFPGTEILFDDGTVRRGVVRTLAPRLDKAVGRVCYPVEDDDGAQLDVDEALIRAVVMPPDPIEQLAQVAFQDLRPRVGRGTAKLPPDAWGPAAFCAREALLRYRDQAWSATGGLVGFTGSRIQALPHQLLVARQVLGDRQIRYLLADEVGLGKTIEAGLIMQSLLAMRPGLRVLIVAPGALVSQWFLEIYVKFGGRQFTMLDSERLRRPSGNPWEDQFVIVSARALETLGGRERIRFASSSWDLVIVDECHRMQVGGRLYRQIATLSRKAPHVLLLSATPGREHPEAYLALLALLQPDAYDIDDRDGFAAKVAAHDQVLGLVARSLDADAVSWPALVADWRDLLGADPVLCSHLEAVQAADFIEARERLLSYVREHYQLDHRVIANRRQVLARLSAETGIKGLALGTRALRWVRYAPDAHERAVRTALVAYRQAVADTSVPLHPRLAHWLLQLEVAAWTHPMVLDRLLAMRAAVLEEPEEYADYRALADTNETLAQVLRSDFSEAEQSTHVAVSAASNCDLPGEGAALEALRQAVARWGARKSPRLQALIKQITAFWQDHPQEKILVFVGHGLAVTLIAEALADALGSGVIETFGAHQDAIEREEAARRFREQDQVAIMVSDPLGGEGRNFQFVSVVVHYELPWSIAAVEQRIGRVDRLGRDGEVPSWVCVSDDERDLDAAWALILDQAVGVFERSSSGLEFVAATIEERALGMGLCQGAAALRADLPAFCDLVAVERADRDQREERLFQGQGDDFAAMSRLADRVGSLEAPVRASCNWLRGMGGQVRRIDDGARPFLLRGRHADDFTEGVFKRDLALQHEHLAFFAQGHDLIDRLIDDAVAAEWCKATAWRRRPDQHTKRWEGLRAAYELQLDLQPLVVNDLSLEHLRRVFAIITPQRPVVFLRFADDEGAVIEEDEQALALLKPPFGTVADDACLSIGSSRQFWVKPTLGGQVEQVHQWQARVRAAGAEAKRHGRRSWATDIAQAQADLQRSLDADLAVLRGQLAAAEQRLGADHADSRRLSDELAADEAICAALQACLAGASFSLSSLAYVIVA